MHCYFSSFVQVRVRRAFFLMAVFTVATLNLASVAFSYAYAATLAGAIGAHDPSRIIQCNGKYYVYSTGGGMKYSSDGINWTAGPSPFPQLAPKEGARPGWGDLPASLKAVIPDHRGIWAPDVLFYQNKYLLYYSACAPHTISRCGIGLLTSPTLDPSAPDYKWTDAGVVLTTDNKVLKKSAIDPAPFVDAKGDLWMSWGSGYANGASDADPTIIISKLDNATGLRSTTDITFYPVAPGRIEASYVHYHSGYYYAFWNDGGCCSGTDSTYRIFVARSASPIGPYVNKAGQQGKGDVFMESDKDKQVYGPGQIGIESEPGLDRFSFHYYNATGRPVLGVRTLVWSADGWPSVGEDSPPSSSVVANPLTTQAAKGGYLFTTFKNGDVPGSEQIYFGLSQDGMHWDALNNGNAALVSTVGEEGVRDSYLLRSHDGKKFFLIATDLAIGRNPDWKRARTAGSRSIVIWESEDLVKWSVPRLVKVAPDDAGSTWAPEAIYDDQTGDYMVYWASTTRSDNYAKMRIWSAHTREFREFSKPSVYIENAFIDTDIVRERGKYYRFSSDTKNKDIRMEVADNLAGPWTNVHGYSLAGMHGYEGPAVFQLPSADGSGKDGDWCLLLDFASKGEGYKAFTTNTLATGAFSPNNAITFPFAFRHGSVLSLSASEYQRVKLAYDNGQRHVPN